MTVQMLTTPTVTVRGQYDELLTVTGIPASDILARFAHCYPTKPYANWDRKMRGSSLNYDLYGYDGLEDVAVVQARQAFRGAAKHFLSTRKSYLLMGHNEDLSPFAHPVSSAAVRRACRNGGPVDVVRAAQRWMWQCTGRQLEQGIRQGDVLLVPERGTPPGDPIELGTEYVVGGSHRIRSARICRTAKWVYAINPSLRHLRGQHEPVGALVHDGWYSVRLANEAASWDFAPRSAD